MFKVVGPSQTLVYIPPYEYTFNIQAKSFDNLPFDVSGFFIIGPSDDEKRPLKYRDFVYIRELVLIFIEGATRILAASMTMEEIIRGIKHFKQLVINNVQVRLERYGLHVFDANVKQLVLVPRCDRRLRWKRPIKLLLSMLSLKSKG